MARPREFDPETSVLGAMNIFWRQGYLATNLPDLLRAMGLTRGSFYKAFHDKETAYMAALECYDRTVVSKTVAMLDKSVEETAEASLAPLFAETADPRRGCFICNAMVDVAADNAAVADRANAMASRIRDAIRGVLERHGVAGRVGDAAATSDLILHLYFGHQAMGRAGRDRSDWPDHLRKLLTPANP